MSKEICIGGFEKFGMMESNLVGSPIVPGFKISRYENGDFVDETYYK